MSKEFYRSKLYREKQSENQKKVWREKLVDYKPLREKRICAFMDCNESFSVKPSNPKKYCSQSCAAKTSNTNRKQSVRTKKKISLTLTGHPNPYKGTRKVERVEIVCGNAKCAKIFLSERWKKAKYCSNKCVMKIVGGRPTSPKASRGKAGVRKDISPSIYFHSRWEANIVRLYNYLGTKWEYEPKTFDIGEQMYTPDFYLPDENKFVEVKNFWWKYSKVRDKKFRKVYPNIRLDVILKEHYLKLEKQYAHLIPKWEYKNSKFPI